MIVKGIIDEDFINYKYPCMTIQMPKCTFKCDKECGQPVCQNSALASTPDINVDVRALVRRYINNPITSAVCLQGLEPFDSWDDLYELVKIFRQSTNDDIIIYTGYKKDEIEEMVKQLKQYRYIIVKYGRYIPGQQPHYDEVLGVNLASDNQYAERIS